MKTSKQRFAPKTKHYRQKGKKYDIGRKLVEIIRGMTDYEGDIKLTKDECIAFGTYYLKIDDLRIKKGQKIDPKDLEFLNSSIKKYLDYPIFDYNDQYLSLNQMRLFLAYWYLLKNQSHNTQRNYELWRYLGKWSKCLLDLKDFLRFMVDFYDVIGTILSSFVNRVYYFEINVPNLLDHVLELKITINVSIHHATTRMFNDGTDRRMAYRFMVPMDHAPVMYVTKTIPAQFNNGIEQKLPVYIQGHAFERLKERLDVFPVSHILIFLKLHFLTDNQMHKSGDRLFSAFKLFGEKLGYLVAVIIDQCLVIKTFHFITHVQTPEGKLLRKIAHLQAEDIKYWDLDKLSTFTSADKTKHPQFVNLLEKAGCEYLFDIEPSKDDIEDKISVIGDISKFIKRGVNEVKNPV